MPKEQLGFSDLSKGPWQEWAQQHSHLEAKTALGEIILIEPRRQSAWDWTSKYLTTSCPSCTLYIPQEEAAEVARTLHLFRIRTKERISTINEVQGICAFGDTARWGNPVRKFLVENTHHSPRVCCISKEEILERAEGKRERGELTNPTD